MQFRIGAFVYTLKIIQNLTDDQGRQCRGLAIHDSREILIDASIHRTMRKSILLHELSHCWDFHVPAPLDGEDRAKLNELIYTTFSVDFEEQNGDELIEKMLPDGVDEAESFERILEEPGDVMPMIYSEPVRSVSAAVHPGLASHETASCPICDTRRSGGSIITSPPILNEKCNGWVVDRTGYCEGCHILYRWQQLCSRSGIPLDNAVATEPEIIKGKEVDSWLEMHEILVGSSDW